MVTNTSFAVYRGSSCGPTFGGGHDIYIADNANQNANSYTNFGTSYSLPNGVTNSSTILAGTRYFSPDEVEVFYLAWVLLTPWFPCAELVWNQWKIHPKNLFKTYCKADHRKGPKFWVVIRYGALRSEDGRVGENAACCYTPFFWYSVNLSNVGELYWTTISKLRERKKSSSLLACVFQKRKID